MHREGFYDTAQDRCTGLSHMSRLPGELTCACRQIGKSGSVPEAPGFGIQLAQNRPTERDQSGHLLFEPQVTWFSNAMIQGRCSMNLGVKSECGTGGWPFGDLVSIPNRTKTPSPHAYRD